MTAARQPPGGAPDIGARLRRLRQAHKLSLDELAAASGVSKSVLSQAERNRNNPTLSTLWRIAGALDIALPELLRAEPAADACDRLTAHDTPVIRSRDGKCLLRILGPVSTIGRLQWYDMTLEAGGRLDSRPHDPGTREHLTLLQGRVTVRAGAAEHALEAGETLRYPADVRHVISNGDTVPARALMVVLLGRGGA